MEFTIPFTYQIVQYESYMYTYKIMLKDEAGYWTVVVYQIVSPSTL